MKASNFLLAIAISITSFTLSAGEATPTDEFGAPKEVAVDAEVENPIAKLNWQRGPNTQSIDGKATLQVPENTIF